MCLMKDAYEQFIMANNRPSLNDSIKTVMSQFIVETLWPATEMFRFYTGLSPLLMNKYIQGKSLQLRTCC